MADGLCDKTMLHGRSIYGRNPPLSDVRRSLQGYARCFPSQNYYRYRKLAEAVVWAEIIFDHETTGAKEQRSQCVFAAASLGLLLCVNLFPWRAVVQLFQTMSFNGFEDSREVLAAKEVLVSLQQALTEPWTSDPSAIAWPFFALLAILSERLADISVISQKADNVSAEGLWRNWLISGGDWCETTALILEQLAGNWSLPDVGHLSTPSHTDPCDADFAFWAAHSAVQFVQRTGGHSQDWLRLASLEAVQQVVRRCLEAFHLGRLLTPPWATLWRGLDRLSASRDVTVFSEFKLEDTRIHVSEASRRLLESHSEPVTFPMSLHPPHIIGLEQAEEGFWFLADRIRAMGSPHCNPAFQYVAEMLDLNRTMRGGQWPIRLVDVGAHLGDCTLWSAARWSSGVRVLAVEMRKDHSANIRRASGLARHPQGIVEVQAIQVVAEADCAEEQDIQTMDCILDNWKLNPEDDVHLVSLYLGFRVELDALRGALRWLHAGRVQAVLVRSTSTEAVAFWDFVKETEVPYRIVTLRVDHDLLFVKSGSFLDYLLH
ncbi:unnamed protein product [Durusdinium trenchii]|uniref:Uncharacterized protein n=1 Tax=Durusdinium trenchii TaxID=1381693 RepID=A0ABP0NA26_9DINO